MGATGPADWYGWHCCTPVSILPPLFPFFHLPSTLPNSLGVVVPHVPVCWCSCLHSCQGIITGNCAWSLWRYQAIGKSLMWRAILTPSPYPLPALPLFCWQLWQWPGVLLASGCAWAVTTVPSATMCHMYKKMGHFESATIIDGFFIYICRCLC